MHSVPRGTAVRRRLFRGARRDRTRSALRRCRVRDSGRRRESARASQERAHALERRARGQRRVEVAALRGRQQLDGDDVRRILRHRRQAGARRARPSTRGPPGWPRSGSKSTLAGWRALLVLGDQRRRRHLRDHEAGVEARPRRQERRQAGERRIDQHGDPPLGDRADLADGERDHVGGEGRPARRGSCRPRAPRRLRRRPADCRRRRWPRSRASPRPGAAGRARRPSPAAGSAGNRGPARARRR